MVKFFFITLLIVFTSCRIAEGDLNGHWHLKNKNKEVESLVDELPTIDIIDDTVAILGLHISAPGGIIGYVNHDDKTISLGGECWFKKFSYQIRNKQLMLSEIEMYDNKIATKYVGYKCDETCCDKQKEFFGDSKIDIDLPVVHEFSELDTIKSWALVNEIKFGTPKLAYQKNFSKGHQLVLGNKFAVADELELYNEMVKIKIPENRRDQIKHVILADKATPMIEIFKVFNKQNELGIKAIYIGLREKDVYKKLKIWLKGIDLNQVNLNVDYNLTLEQWVEKY